MSNRQQSVDETPTLDLKMIFQEWNSGGLRVILTWFWDEPERRHDCCIVLMDMSMANPIPCIIPIANAQHWALHKGIGDPMHVANTVQKWIKDGCLPGTVGSKRDAMRILTAVDSALLPLKHMPPRPKVDFAVLGEGMIMDRTTGKILTQREFGVDV